MVSSVVHQYYGLNLEDKCENPAYKLITPVSYEAAIVLVQNLVLMPFLVSYMSMFQISSNYRFPNFLFAQQCGLHVSTKCNPHQTSNEKSG